jgi:DNA topoisomerase-2
LILPEDNCLLNYKVDDGHSVEPETFFPILPLVLLNGARGVATGWSTSILSYNPMGIAASQDKLCVTAAATVFALLALPAKQVTLASTL